MNDFKLDLEWFGGQFLLFSFLISLFNILRKDKASPMIVPNA